MEVADMIDFSKRLFLKGEKVKDEASSPDLSEPL